MELHSFTLRGFLAGFIGSAVVFATATSAPAATIIWGTPMGISGDSNVSTTGTLVGAFNVGGPGVASTTVNGTTFTGLALSGPSVTSGNFNLSIATSFSITNSAGSGSIPFSNLSSSYQALLSSGAGDGATAFTLTMSALVATQTYQFEWWSNFSASPASGLTTATAGNAISLNSNPTMTPGGVGQFGIGTFVADSATQVITFSTTTETILNGFQLRQLVPEPGSALLLLLGASALSARRRR